MDIFLETVENDYDGILGKHKEYINRIKSFESFLNVHYLESYQPTNFISYSEKNAICLIGQATKRIKERAMSISVSECSDDLWRFFNEMGLLKNE